MRNRPILCLPEPRPARRLRGPSRHIPRPSGAGVQRQKDRFSQQFNRLRIALKRPGAEVELRLDPFGIAPERALVFVTAAPINDFAHAANLVDLEILSEFDLNDTEQIPRYLISQNGGNINPKLYATMPTSDTFRNLLSLWHRYERGERAERGYSAWWHLFDLLAELRAWGPKDRLTAENCLELENRLPLDDDDGEVKIEIEHWPTENRDLREQWRKNTKAQVKEMGGRIIHQSSIHEENFHYEALLIGLSARQVREMIKEPSAISGLAMLDGIQFILPQTISQSLPSQSPPMHLDINNLEHLETKGPLRVLLLDGTPVSGHPALNGGIIVEDVHDLVGRSIVSSRRHATEMASLILRGDLVSDGQRLTNSRVLAVPVLIDTEDKSLSPNDRLFIDLVHVALQRVFGGDNPLAPSIFVVNFSIGVHGSHFAGQISSLARLLDWWSYKAGILFVVSAGNIPDDLEIDGTTFTDFEDCSIPQRQSLVQSAQRHQSYRRTLLSPSEALNVLTVGAASRDSDPSSMGRTPRTVEICTPSEILPAISSGRGLGPFQCIKPDLIATGGQHEVMLLPKHNAVKLRVLQETPQTGLAVARSIRGKHEYSRSRGTSCATALVTRFLVSAGVALTEEGGPYDGYELSRTDLALVTRALAVNGSRWPETANNLYAKEKQSGRKYQQAAEEVVRHFGYGFLNPELMYESPLNGATLVGFGQIRKDGATIFDMPLPSSLSGKMISRSILITLAWFSPIEPTNATYRLAALEAVAADGSMQADEEKDNEWGLGMKSDPPSQKLISRGTIWSRRLVHKRNKVTTFSDEETLPIRVQCRDRSRSGLNPDEEIHFAIAVTVQLETTVQSDILEEIRNRLLVHIPTH